MSYAGGPARGLSPCVLALGGVWAELAAERLKGALDGKRQDEQASQDAPLAVDAVSACGAPVQSPGEKEGRRRNPEPKDGGPQLLVSPRLGAATFPGGTSTAGALAWRAVMTAMRVLRSCSLIVQSEKRCRRYARRPASEGHPAPSRPTTLAASVSRSQPLAHPGETVRRPAQGGA